MRMLKCIPAALLVPALLTARGAPAEKPQSQRDARQHGTGIEAANVLFRYSPELSIYVVRLRGELLPTAGHSVPSFNDPASFVIATDAAEIRMTTAQLEVLMNAWLLRSPKAQIEHLRITASGDRLLLDGAMKKGIHLPFHAAATLGTTADNRIRITLQQVKTAHLPVKGLMDTLGISLQDLVSQKGLKGMSVDGDSFLIDPQTAFPSPQIRARLAGVRVAGDGIAITFGKGAPRLTNPLAKNYIYLRGGSLRYGREEMTDADLMMIDSTPADPFDFYLREYWCQMVAGNIKVTPDRGLRVRVPDYAKLKPGACKP